MEKIQALAVKFEACRLGIEAEALAAFIEVESGGRGFDPATGKIVIQFEPKYFFERTKVMISNSVGRQSTEWEAFNEAFSINPNAAMESTSIGLGQVMGAHWKRLGYKSVGEMWDDAKECEDRQIYQMAEFIRTDSVLMDALKRKDWHTVAVRYNGVGYIRLAKRLNREPYNISMRKAYFKYLNQKL